MQIRTLVRMDTFLHSEKWKNERVIDTLNQNKVKLFKNKCMEPIDDKGLEHRVFTYYTNLADR